MTDTERRTDKVMRKERYLLRTYKISRTKQILFYEQGSEVQITNHKLNSGKAADDFS